MVEPNNRRNSTPEVIVMKSKHLGEGGSSGKAACLARNSNTKNISLEVSPNEVVYEQSPPILTSEGLYNAIKVVNMTEDTKVICTATFDGIPYTGSTSEPTEKENENPGEIEEPATGKVCNTTDTSTEDRGEARQQQSEGQQKKACASSTTGGTASARSDSNHPEHSPAPSHRCILPSCFM